MTKKVVVLDLGATADEAAKLMRKHGVGSVIVIDRQKGKKARGILTERDLVHKLIALNKDPYKTKVDAVMSSPLRVVHPETSLEEAAKAMRENHIKRLPVVNDKNELVGVLSEGDIMNIFPAVVDLLEERVSE